ncbi:MAG: OadG family protein [Lentisphaerae bacterium]|nr:OadG family protein [Lentisphaerota bacterium]
MEALKIGILLVFVGMGAVFSFLAVMVLCVQCSARLLAPFTHLMPEKEPPRRKAAPGAKAAPPAAGQAVSARVVPVITAAIHQHLADKP